MNDVIIDTKEVDRVMKALGMSRDAIIRTIGFDIESAAKQLAPVDTSAMRNSIYTETPDGNTFDVASSNALSKNPKVTTIQHPKPEKGFVNVGPSVNYAEFVEFGTSKQSAQPYLVPAAESVSQKFNSGERWKGLTGHESN
ncbi:MAG: HK97-gp10 family putative phage morphogenesis protein [Clostridia bacterium]|jgi:HK97 gp10 family phage protein